MTDFIDFKRIEQNDSNFNLEEAVVGSVDFTDIKELIVEVTEKMDVE